MINKTIFGKTYGKTISNNTDLNDFAKFLLKHDFKAVKITARKKHYPNRNNDEMLPKSSLNAIPYNWNKKTEVEKFKTLIEAFGLETTINDWLITLPKMNKLYSQLKNFSQEELKTLYENI